MAERSYPQHLWEGGGNGSLYFSPMPRKRVRDINDHVPWRRRLQWRRTAAPFRRPFPPRFVAFSFGKKGTGLVRPKGGRVTCAVCVLLQLPVASTCEGGWKQLDLLHAVELTARDDSRGRRCRELRCLGIIPDAAPCKQVSLKL